MRVAILEDGFLVFVLRDVGIAGRDKSLGLNLGVTTAGSDRNHRRNDTEKRSLHGK